MDSPSTVSTRLGRDRPRVQQLSGARVAFILAIMAITNMLNAMDRQIFPILAPVIREDFGFTLGQTGLLTTVFTLGIGLVAIPAGLLGDRYRRKRIIVLSIVVFSAATALQAMALTFWDLLAYRILTGVGEGIQNAVLFAVVGAFFHRHRTMAIGVLTAAYGLGAFVSPIVGARLLAATGHWEVPMLTLGAFGIVVCALWTFVPRTVTEKDRNQRVPHVQETSSSSPITSIFTRNVIVLGAVCALAGFAIYAYLGLYPTYLVDKRGFTVSSAGTAISMFGVGGLTAIPLGALADRWNQKLCNLVALAGFMVIGPSVFLTSAGLPVQAALSFVMGALFTGVVYTNGMSLMQLSLPKDRVALASGLFVTCLYIPASFSGYVFGGMVSATGWTVAGVALMGGINLAALLVMCLFRRPSPQATLEATRPAT